MACVFLDCDSTLAALEGIDELARMAGCHAEIAAITDQAMAGTIPFGEAFQRRFTLVRPSQEMLGKLAKQYQARLVPGAQEAVQTLQEAGHGVWIVSAGPRQAILPMASSLGLQPERVHAVSINWDIDGNYVGYDEDSVFMHSDGKATVCASLCPAGETGIMVGDGATDCVARDVGMLFVQFAGIQDRPQVAERAHARITEPSLAMLPQVVVRLLHQ